MFIYFGFFFYGDFPFQMFPESKHAMAPKQIFLAVPFRSREPQ